MSTDGPAMITSEMPGDLPAAKDAGDCPHPTAEMPLESSTARRWLIRSIYGLVAVLVAGSLAFNILQPIKVLPRVQLAPGFVFVDQNGSSKNSEEYRGKITLFAFSAPGCVDCFDTDQAMTAVRSRLVLDLADTPDSPELAMVSLSLLPEADTSRPHFGEPIPWDVLAGDADIMKYVVGGGFGQYYQLELRADGTSTVDYDPIYALVDGWGIVRAKYTRGLDPNRVVRDLRYLTQELRHQEGLSRLAYEAAHLFRCYP